MHDNISDPLLLEISKRITAQMGLHFPEEQWIKLRRGLKSAAKELGFDETDSFGRWLLSSPLTQKQVKVLAQHLTVGETYFFRDENAFNALQEHVFPAILLSRNVGTRRLRIWCAGCSTGEEPYSLAILLTRIIPDIHHWNITILATDVNPRSLQKATEAVYGEWSFRSPPSWLKDQYFAQQEDGHKLLSHIKQMVQFESLNLAEDVYPSLSNGTNAMDLIICRNVLIYFSRALQERVVRNFHHALVDGGWLIVSPSEATSALFSQFVTVNFPGAVFFLKSPKREELQQIWFARTFGFNEPVPPGESIRVPPGVKPALTRPKPPTPLYIPEPLPDQQPLSRSLYEQAVALYRQGRYHRVVAMLAHTPENSSDKEIIALLAHAYANQGNLTEALKWCERGIALDRRNPCFLYLRATILQEQNRIDDAMMSLRQTLMLDSGFALAYFALGNLTRQQGRFKEAQKHFMTVQQLLRQYQPHDILPESDGITVERLREMVADMLAAEDVDLSKL